MGSLSDTFMVFLYCCDVYVIGFANVAWIFGLIFFFWGKFLLILFIIKGASLVSGLYVVSKKAN